MIKYNIHQNTTHGMKGSLEYSTWGSMSDRCNNPLGKDYQRYAARGIKICARWAKFENFYEDMGPKPEGMSLDRIDNDGDYSPDNCRWASPKEQARNRRGNLLVQHKGKLIAASEADEIMGFCRGTVSSRITRSGWSDFDAINTPIDKRFSRKQK